MPQVDQSDSDAEATGSDTSLRRNGHGGTEVMTEYEKQRMKRIEENKARMKAMGLDKMASSFMSSVPISQKTIKKGKRKMGLEDDEEYKPPAKDDEETSSSSQSDEDDKFRVSRTKSKLKNSTPTTKGSKFSASDFVDDDDALMKAIALSLQDSPGVLDVASKTSSQNYEANASSVENTERKQIVRKDDSGKRKRKTLFTSRVQMTEDELILHFFQFDESGKGGINLRDLRRVAASHDFLWSDEEMGYMIQFFDSDGDGKLSLDDFTKIVERCNMRQGSENAERTSLASGV